ncbi:NAD(P)/FAD-dependent oxidoreductase [Mucisphaera sp.]|uniref:NAD(P)/FAD-dependent oxidoreductase n=1 Tax=Mucisphaera sp. TaxID=2913024 RepID=UPI003D0E09F8
MTDATDRRRYDLVVVGAGAAGLMASIAAGRESHGRLRIAALDGAKKLGAKILVAGGGRCNVTHDVVKPEDYAGASRPAINKVLKAFTVEQTVTFFRELNVHLKREETGKLFPTTDSARTVLDALIGATKQAGVDICTETRVLSIKQQMRGFEIDTSAGCFEAGHVVIATGGKSLPKTGSDGKGYELVSALGHTIDPTWPALVPLVLPESHWLTTLSGLAVEAELRVHAGNGRILHREHGPCLFTHFGLSGPIPMNLSRHLTQARQDDAAASMTLNLLDGASFEDADRRLRQAITSDAGSTILTMLRRNLPDSLARAIIAHVLACDPRRVMAQLTKETRHLLIRTLTELPIPVVRDRGYLFAEVTAGGVPLSEVHLKSMASKVCDSLSLCGEILNVDGRIGGYNFQWAWASGHLAGQHAARSLLEPSLAAPVNRDAV